MHSDDLMKPGPSVVVFMCNHCPFVVHVLDALIETAHSYQAKGIQFIAISSNDVEHYPQDDVPHMKALAEDKDFPFPYLFDATQEVAKAYDAACTPDFSIFDQQKRCVYRGQFDSSRPGNGLPINGADLKAALDTLLRGEEVSPTGQVPSIGCNIKWKPGNEPG